MLTQSKLELTAIARRLFLALIFLAVVIYVASIYRFSYNMPYGDDYDAVLGFLSQYVGADGWSRLVLIFSQHNEHRVFLTHVLEVIDWQIFGQVNFTHLIWLGNLGWFLVVWVMWSYAQSRAISFIDFGPVIVLLLSFSHHEMMTWAMTSIQQYYQVLFSILAIAWMVQQRWLLFTPFFLLAVFTGGGGLILIPVLLAFLLWSKNYRLIPPFLLLFIGTLYIYFALLPYTNLTPSTKFLDALSRPIDLATFALGFIGGAGHLQQLGLPSILMFGFLLLILFINQARFMLKEQPFLAWICIYIGFTAGLAALNRLDIGVHAGGDSRYSEYSLLFCSCLYLSYLLRFSSEATQRKMIGWGYALTSLLFIGWYFQAFTPLNDRLYWLKNGYPTYPDHSKAHQLLDLAKDKGIFSFPSDRLKW